jgi:ABC-type lipoprotein release transport system permease subunit
MFAIGFSAFFMIFGGGYSEGMKKQLLQLMTDSYTGDYTIVSESVKLKSDPSPIQVGWNEMMTDDNGYLRGLQSDSNVAKVLRRMVLYANVMGKNDVDNDFTIIVGCDFANEQEYALSKIKFQGQYHRQGDIVYINEKIGQKLNLKLGDDIYLFFVGENGMPIPTKLKVGGIFVGRGFPAVSENQAFIDYAVLKRSLHLATGTYSSVLVVVKQKTLLEKTFPALQKKIPPQWKIVLPKVSGKFFIDIYTAVSFSSWLSNLLMYITIFLFVYSTLIISTYNRHREIGIMNSLGLSKRRIFWLLSSEGVVLGLFPSLIGSTIGFIGVMILSRIGIPATNDAMKYMFASDVLYFQFNGWLLFNSIVLISIIAFLGSIPPIVNVLKLKPVDALKEI